MHELPTVAEATWHGASLACAEMARRGLIIDSRLSDVLQWQGKVRSPETYNWLSAAADHVGT